MQRWDIFCRVVDNFGDAGVAWRLARQLCTEHAVHVRLLIDDLPTLARLDHRIDAQKPEQVVAGVTLCQCVHALHGRLDQGQLLQQRPTVVGVDSPTEYSAADVVIETFGCELPEAYLAAMAAQQCAPLWINLEHLSAEHWVEDCHGLPSPQTRHPLTRYFFFPGFTEGTGGLLREQEIRSWLMVSGAGWGQTPIQQGAPAIKVTLFGYEGAPIQELINTWVHSPTPIHCEVTEGTPLAVAAAAQLQRAANASVACVGSLQMKWVPFCDQVDFDAPLRAATINFVRGEDSFVRAQWAARPFVWHIYPQTEGAHWVKLNAFLDRYSAGWSADLSQRYRQLVLAWNGEGDIGAAWQALQGDWAALQEHAETWSKSLLKQADLASNLAKFAADLL
jgi:uncharacterized repeat protein (TIGR03837 family)